MKALRLSTLAAMLVCAALGQTATAAPVLVKAAHLFDARSALLRGPSAVLVDNGKIVAVGDNLAVPAGAQVIDLGDATLLPGFIDAHVHITGESSDNPYKDFYLEALRPAVEQSFYAAKYARTTLMAGFTTVRVVGADSFIDVALRNAINNGIAVGPRIIAAGHAIGSPGSHCDQSPYPPERVHLLGPLEGVCSGPEQCREAVRLQMKFGADVIKICASGGVLSESDPLESSQLTPAELEAIVGEAHTWGRKVAAHAHGDHAARLAIEAGVDSIEHGSFLTPDTLKLMKAKGTYLVPTRLAAFWVGQKADAFPPPIAKKAKAVGTRHAEMVKEAYRLGVPMAFGTDSAVSPHGMNAREFSLLTELGVSPAAALLSATRDGARLLGIEAETGTIEAGKSADLVAVPGNVLDHIEATEHPSFVMLRGEVVLH